MFVTYFPLLFSRNDLHFLCPVKRIFWHMSVWISQLQFSINMQKKKWHCSTISGHASFIYLHFSLKFRGKSKYLPNVRAVPSKLTMWADSFDRVMLIFFKIICVFLYVIIILHTTSSSPIPIFFSRFCTIYSLNVCATPFPLITLGLNAQLGVTTTTTVATTTTNGIINGTVPTNINVVSSPIPPAVVTTVTTLLPINNVRIATTPIVSAQLRSRSAQQRSVVSLTFVRG